MYTTYPVLQPGHHSLRQTTNPVTTMSTSVDLSTLIAQSIEHAILANQTLRRAIWATCPNSLTTDQALLITELVAIVPRAYQPHIPHISLHPTSNSIDLRVRAIIAILDHENVPLPEFLRRDFPPPADNPMFPYRQSGTPPPPSEQ